MSLTYEPASGPLHISVKLVAIVSRHPEKWLQRHPEAGSSSTRSRKLVAVVGGLDSLDHRFRARFGHCVRHRLVLPRRERSTEVMNPDTHMLPTREESTPQRERNTLIGVRRRVGVRVGVRVRLRVRVSARLGHCVRR